MPCPGLGGLRRGYSLWGGGPVLWTVRGGPPSPRIGPTLDHQWFLVVAGWFSKVVYTDARVWYIKTSMFFQRFAKHFVAVLYLESALLQCFLAAVSTFSFTSTLPFVHLACLKFGFAKVRLKQCAGPIVYRPLPSCPHYSKRTIALKGVLLRVCPLGTHDCCMGALFQQKTSFAMVLQCSKASPGFAEDRPVLTTIVLDRGTMPRSLTDTMSGAESLCTSQVVECRPRNSTLMSRSLWEWKQDLHHTIPWTLAIWSLFWHHAA